MHQERDGLQERIDALWEDLDVPDAFDEDAPGLAIMVAIMAGVGVLAALVVAGLVVLAGWAGAW